MKRTPLEMKGLWLGLVAILGLGLGDSAQSKPNIVLFLIDDLGWMDLSCQGSDYYQTPNIDRLAQEGMRFTNGYAACAVCSPTRAAVQTGRYPGRLGVTDWIRSRFQRGNIGTPEANPTEYVGGKNRPLLCPPNPYWMESEERTVAEILQDADYKTGYIGKWHLGDDDWYPEEQGYLANRGGCDYAQPPSYFDPFNQPNHRHPMIQAGIPGLPGREPGQYLTHREADEAVALIEEWKDEAFFLQVAHYAVHTPIQAIEEVAAKYAREDKKPVNARYAAMVESVDDAVGSVLETLDRLELTDDTLIVFTSDNGGLLGPTDNTPLRSGKGYAYEGGIRVPFIASWPGTIPSGSVSDTPVVSIDILPTLVEAAGLPMVTDRPIDGVSLMSTLKGEAEDFDRALIWHFPHYRHAPGPYSIIRREDHKLIYFWEGIRELYDLGEDLGEKVNLVQSRASLAASLETELLNELGAMGARLPKPNPAFGATQKD